MAAFSTYLEDAIINHVLRNDALASPSDVYVALFTDSASAAELEDNNTSNEVSSYTRQHVSFDAPSNGETQNSAQIEFSDMPAVTVGYAAVMDSSSAGNILFHGALATPRTLQQGDSFVISEGELDITLD